MPKNVGAKQFKNRLYQDIGKLVVPELSNQDRQKEKSPEETLRANAKQCR